MTVVVAGAVVASITAIYCLYIACPTGDRTMTTSTVFTNNRTQAVRLPADSRFPAHVRRVEVRVVGPDRVISPAGAAWDSFFDTGVRPTDDFMADRADQQQAEREAF